MRLANSDYSIDFSINENEVYEIVVEAASTFSDIVGTLVGQKNGSDGTFYFSEGNKVLKFDKVSDVLIDYFSISINSRKILSSLYSEMEAIANEDIERKVRINAEIISVLDSIVTSVGESEVSYNLDFKWTDVFKIYNVEFEELFDSLAEKLISYVRLVSRFTDIKLLFLVNARAYFSQEELNSIYEIANYCKTSIVLLEPCENVNRGLEKRFIIDRDLCLIDAN